MASSAAETVWTIGSLLKWTEDYLRGKGIESPRLDAQVLLAHVLNCSRAQLYARFDEEPTEASRAQFRELIRRRVEGTPVAYLIGYKEFYLLRFEVTPDVLIPRPETETLVLTAITNLKAITAPRILDLCCGSGCIAVALAKQLKSAQIVATDISPAAVAVAQRNAHKHQVESRIDLRIGDLYSIVRPGELFHAVVCNPPYIRSSDIATLAPDVREHEPRLALDGGTDGFVVIDRLIAGAAERLESDGWLMFEIGIGQEMQCAAKLAAEGLKTDRPILDAAGIPRVILGRKP